MTTVERSIELLAAALGRLPGGGPCAFCGHPDARHRVADAMVERWHVGESFGELAAEFGCSPLDAAEAVAASLDWEVTARRSRATQAQQDEALRIFWPVAS